MSNHIKYLPLLFFFVFTGYTAKAQYFKVFANTMNIEKNTGSVELSNGNVMAFTESSHILLVKTNANGNIKWAKRYDAGTGIAIRFVQMIKTKDNHLLILGEISENNNPNDKRFVLKVNENGNLVWAKKYFGEHPYQYHGIAELNDSSLIFSYQTKDYHPGIIHTTSNGTLITASWFNELQFTGINNINNVNGAAEFTVDNRYLLNINAAANTINWQRKYNTSNQFTALLSNRCTNGDIICLAGRTSGGLLNGTARLFRTKENGQLRWAKNMRIDYNTSGSQFSIFDIVSQVSVHEDKNGNIVAIVMDESTRNVMVVFDKKGNYQYNRFFNDEYSMLSENNDGTYFQTAPYTMGTTGPAYSKRSLQAISDCDSTLPIAITDGTDSAAALTPLSLSTGKVRVTDIDITITEVTFSTENYCTLQSKHAVEKADDFYIQVYPIPAQNKLNVVTKKNLPFIIYDANGVKMLQSMSNTSTNISKLQKGIYMVELLDNGVIVRRKFIKN